MRGTTRPSPGERGGDPDATEGCRAGGVIHDHSCTAAVPSQARDAVGQAWTSKRGARLITGGHDEREQTLNQLLAEMGGFDQSSGIVLLAVTNRPETLDPALLRPGRFDRQVIIPLPNQAERAAILAAHAKSTHLADDVDLDRIARGTPGFSGADLANLVNAGAINAVRAGRTVINATDLDAARDRVLLDRRETSNALLPEEWRAVAVHESARMVREFGLSSTLGPVGYATGSPQHLGSLTEDALLRPYSEQTHCPGQEPLRPGGRIGRICEY